MIVRNRLKRLSPMSRGLINCMKLEWLTIYATENNFNDEFEFDRELEKMKQLVYLSLGETLNLNRISKHFLAQSLLKLKIRNLLNLENF